MTDSHTNFSDMGLSAPLLSALKDMNYIQPSPIQEECIPPLLKGHDILGMAQTGSGKTAAFLLPLLSNISPQLKAPQILVLAPTRELAIQVAEACATISKYMDDVNVLALYGGQRYDVQLRSLRQGPQVVVGTPGRLIDHLRRGTLKLSKLRSLVLDEADEMLRMGFIEDVESIMSEIPDTRQTALFSATMPEAIRRITKRFMDNPKEVRIESNTSTRPDIIQSYWPVHGRKNDALVRFLEVEDFDAAIIFVRTKSATLEVAEALERSGHNSGALNGDMNQTLREQTLERLRKGRLDILIATDVAARGLDVDRISLVVNYDIPLDTESYIHRIGRTGRAGRAGRAILFVENRERRLLKNIERSMKLNIKEVALPSAESLSDRRQQKFSESVYQQSESSDLNQYSNLLEKLFPDEEKLDRKTLAAILLKMAQKERPLVLRPDLPRPVRRTRKDSDDMNLYRIGVGRNDGVEVRHIVGTIANEGNINSRHIGNIKLFTSYSTVELPKNVSGSILQRFINTRILNKQMNMCLVGSTQTKDTRGNQRKTPERRQKTYRDNSHRNKA
jgi:ATP-dependent RNA helicase DeaD